MRSRGGYDDLLEKFFDGATDNREERILYDMFRRGDYPAAWEAYAELFAHFECGLDDDILAALDDREPSLPQKTVGAQPAACGRETVRRGRMRLHLTGRSAVRRAAAIAAVAVISLTVILFVPEEHGSDVGKQSETPCYDRLAEEFRRVETWVAEEYACFERLMNDDPFNDFINMQL